MSDFDPRDPAGRPNPEPTRSAMTNEREWLIALHLSPLLIWLIPVVGNLLGPLVVWLIHKDRSSNIDLHGKEVLNFQLLMSIILAIFLILSLTVILMVLTVPLGFAIYIFISVMAVLGSRDAADGKLRRYPFNLRLIK